MNKAGIESLYSNTTQVYEVRETVFTDQTGQFPTQSKSGKKYIMVMVDIDSSGILVEPLKS